MLLTFSVDFMALDTKLISAWPSVSLKRPVSVVSFSNKKPMGTVSLGVYLLAAGCSEQTGTTTLWKTHKKKSLSRAERRIKWMGVIILQCSLCLSDRPHPLHLHLSTIPPISLLSPSVLSLPICFFFISLSRLHSLFFFFTLSTVSSVYSLPILPCSWQHPSLLPQCVDWVNGWCSVRVTPTGLTLSLLPTPLILHPLLFLIITGYMEQSYRLNT